MGPQRARSAALDNLRSERFYYRIFSPSPLKSVMGQKPRWSPGRRQRTDRGSSLQSCFHLYQHLRLNEAAFLVSEEVAHVAFPDDAALSKFSR